MMSDMNCLRLRNACRLCLFSCCNNIDIFGEKGRRERYQEKIWKHFSLWVCIEDTLPTAICQLCCDRIEEFHLFALKVEGVQQNIHEMVCSQNCCTTNHMSCVLSRRDVQSDQIGELCKETDESKGMNDTDMPQDTHSYVSDLRNNSKITKSPSQTHVINHSHNRLSYLQKQCFAATDTESENVTQIHVSFVKVEADPLQIGNNNTSSAMDTVKVFSDGIKCEPLASEVVSDLLSSGTKCDSSKHASTVYTTSDIPGRSLLCINNEKVADKTLMPTVNLRGKCNGSPVSKEGGSDVEEVQDSTAAKLHCDVRSTAASSEPESQSDSGCSVPSEKRSSAEESESNVDTEPNELSMYSRLSKFYNYSCKICEPETATFSSFFLLCKHYRSKHNTKGYVICCGRKLMSKHLVLSHMLQHIQPGIYKCQECGRELASELTYERHIIHHLPEDKRPFKCEHCLRGFVYKESLKAHLRSHLPDTEKYAFVCNICGKKFASQGGVSAHQRHVHERVCEFMCHICAKIFPTQGILKGHLYCHVAKSERKQCQECGKWLKSDLTLRVHMRCHSGQLFKCPQCDKVFHHKQTMLDHMRCHSSARPYNCPVCGKTFKLKSGLKTHAVQHTGEKPYQCPHCPRTFASSSNYYKHKKRMHAQEGSGSVP